MVGDAGCCGGRERWSASYDDDTGVVTPAVAVGKMVGDVGYCVQSLLDVSGDLQQEPDLGDELRNWHMDDPELESDDEAEVVVWKKKKTVERVQGQDEVSDRSSNTVDG